MRWPIHADKFNTKDYPSNQMLLDDIEAIIRITLMDKLGITSQTVKASSSSPMHQSFAELPLQNYSVILVIPDYYERSYIRNFVQVLLSQIGFKQFTVQQVVRLVRSLIASNSKFPIFRSNLSQRRTELVSLQHVWSMLVRYHPA